MRMALAVMAFLVSLNTIGIPRTMVWTIPDSVASGIHVMFMGRKLMEKKYNVAGGADFSAYLLEQCYRDLQSAFEEIGCEVQFTDHPFIPFDDYYTRDDMSFLRIRVPAGAEPEALKLVAELLQKTRHADADKFQQAMRACLMANRMRRSTGAAAAHALKERLFPDCYVGLPTYLKEPVEDEESLRTFLDAYLAPDNTVVAVAGSVQTKELSSLLAKLFGTEPLKRPALTCKVENKSWKQPLNVIHAGGQGYVLMSAVLPEPGNEREWAALHICTRRISQRISFQLREREGLAYSIGAGVTDVGGVPMVQIHMGTSPSQAALMPERLTALVKEALHQPIDQDELERLCHSLLIDRRMKRLTNINKASFRSLDLLWDREPGFEKRVDDALIKMDLETVRSFLDNLQLSFCSVVVNGQAGESEDRGSAPAMRGMPGGMH